MKEKMTSKEVIQRLKDDIETGYLSTKYDNQKDKENYLFMLETLEKDSEVSEILKKRLYGLSSIKGEECLYVMWRLMSENDSDYKVIKEWLENEEKKNE